ncbi:MAG TPA: magnesium transporter [Gemmatimonadales bacterium]
MKASGLEAGELVALVREGRIATVVDRARHLAAADLADVLAALPGGERLRIVAALPARLAAHALIEMSPPSRPEAILSALGADHCGRLIAELDDDDATDLLGRLAPSERQRILASLGNPVVLGRLLVYPPDSAGGLMTSRLITVSELDPIGLAIEAVRRQASAVIGDVTEIFVVDTLRRLTGVLSVQQILLASPAAVVRDVMAPAPIRVGPNDEQRHVARIITRYNLSSVPVVDSGGRLLGRITGDDIRDATVNDAIEDLLRFGGVSTREAPSVSWHVAVRSRLPSLYTNLLAAFGAAAAVYFFQGTVQRVVTLAVWMPVVAGVGGNAGTQALAASVRRLAVSREHRAGLGQRIAQEAAIGGANGLAIGMVVGAVAVLLGESWKLGVVVAIAMVANLVLASVVGVTIPVILKKAGRDPALASPAFVTAMMDACGFVLLLGLASAVLL